MRRTKAWWAVLNEGERIELWWLEHPRGGGPCDYLPDDCAECPHCSTPHLGSGGLCSNCYNRLEALIGKAEAGVKEAK